MKPLMDHPRQGFTDETCVRQRPSLARWLTNSVRTGLRQAWVAGNMTWVVCGSATSFSLDRTAHPALPIRHDPTRAIGPFSFVPAEPFLAVGVHPPMLHLHLGCGTAPTDTHLGAIGDRSPVPPVMERDATQENAHGVPWVPAAGPHAWPPGAPRLLPVSPSVLLRHGRPPLLRLPEMPAAVAA